MDLVALIAGVLLLSVDLLVALLQDHQRHRSYLERSVDSLQRKVVKETESHKKEQQKIDRERKVLEKVRRCLMRLTSAPFFLYLILYHFIH